MGFLEILTLVFIVLKLMGVVDWGWIWVLMPAIVAFAFYLFWWIITLVFFGKATRQAAKRFDDDDFFK